MAPQTPQNSEFLSRLWYFACASKDVKAGAPIRRVLWGEPIVIGRRRDGQAFAMRDQCPHRGAPLSQGAQRDVLGVEALHCPYHGWAFDSATGACLLVPALSNNDSANPSNVSVRTYDIREANGLIWIFRDEAALQSNQGRSNQGRSNQGPSNLAPATQMPVLPFTLPPQMQVKSVTIVEADGPFDEAVTGLVDPAHTPFVHQQWWWRKGKAAREKTKQFEPLATGFRIPAHTPSGNSQIYKVLGGTPTTQIDFILPGIRIETVRTEKYCIIGLTVITPITDARNAITHCLFWDMPALSLVKPVVEAMTISFLAQDGAILSAQAQNLSRTNNRPLYLGEPDEPAKWVRQLNKAWRTQMMEGGSDAFDNPVEVRALHWNT